MSDMNSKEDAVEQEAAADAALAGEGATGAALAGEGATGTASGGRPWRMAAVVAPLAGVGCIATLIWAVQARLDLWEVESFVLLAYGGALCAVLSSAAVRMALRTGGAAPEWIGPVRGLLWLAVVVAALWAWFPPFKVLVYWYARWSSLLRFT